jgi:hypothetical protein
MSQTRQLVEYLSRLERELWGTLIEHVEFPDTHLDSGNDLPASRSLSFAEPLEGASIQTLRQVIQDPEFLERGQLLIDSIRELRRYLERDRHYLQHFGKLYNNFLNSFDAFKGRYGSVRSGRLGLRPAQGGIPSEMQLAFNDAFNFGEFTMPDLRFPDVDIELLYQELGSGTQAAGGGAASETRGMA